MHQVEPKIFVIAETKMLDAGKDAMLKAIGVPDDWDTDGRDGQELIELAGRLCYKSFGTELNANLTRVREGNKEYIGNVLNVKHGSVLEHASVTVAMIDVSRILTHEYVRHRQGTAFSQESMRFVRLDDIGMYIPDLSKDFEELSYIINDDATQITGENTQRYFASCIKQVTELAEHKIREIAHLLDKPGVPFSLKKKITSALRRMAPGGHTTNIIGTGNHRAWRFQIAQRTAGGAEEEIRKVFGMIAESFKVMYPNIYQDMDYTPVDGQNAYHFKNEKV
jgi:thymidylate synthase (FAD)